MTIGALLAIICGEISPKDALLAVDLDVMFFLFGMFIIGEGIRSSGLLSDITGYILKKSMCNGEIDTFRIIILVIFLSGFFAAVLMNDTVAIIGTPVVLLLAMRCGLSPKKMLLLLCFSLTTGSITSPVGSPHNYLIATSAANALVQDPFELFIITLFVPTIVSLLLLVLIFRPEKMKEGIVKAIDLSTNENPSSKKCVILAISILILILCLRCLLEACGIRVLLPLYSAALAGAIIILIGSNERISIVKKIDWRTLLFFVSMFVLMQSVYNSGVLDMNMNALFSTPISLMVTGIIVSQFISNVPFIALFLSAISNAAFSAVNVAALAAGSTLAGNLTILGAASNVIVLSRAEQEGVILSQWEFFRLGALITTLQAVIFGIWFMIF